MENQTLKQSENQSEKPLAKRLGKSNRSNGHLARGLGWFSIALGLIEVAAPRLIARLAGMRDDQRVLIQALGLREIVSGIVILSQKKPLEGVWSRVGGDAIDLAVLGTAFASPKTNRTRLATATAAVLGVTAVDVLCAKQLGYNKYSTVKAKKSLIISRSPEDLYKLWRDFESFPRFMNHVKSVRTTGENRSHWVVKGPAGFNVEWDAEITEDRPNELIAWRTVEHPDVNHTGSVRFERAPGGRGTIVRVEIAYSPPAGKVGVAVAKLLGEEPEQQIQEDLRRFKQIMEVGEVVQSEASYYGTGLLEQRPAQPLPKK